MVRTKKVKKTEETPKENPNNFVIFPGTALLENSPHSFQVCQKH